MEMALASLARLRKESNDLRRKGEGEGGTL